jgi:hypothetical protein
MLTNSGEPMTTELMAAAGIIIKQRNTFIEAPFDPAHQGLSHRLDSLSIRRRGAR